MQDIIGNVSPMFLGLLCTIWVILYPMGKAIRVGGWIGWICRISLAMNVVKMVLDGTFVPHPINLAFEPGPCQITDSIQQGVVICLAALALVLGIAKGEVKEEEE